VTYGTGLCSPSGPIGDDDDSAATGDDDDSAVPIGDDDDSAVPVGDDDDSAVPIGDDDDSGAAGDDDDSAAPWLGDALRFELTWDHASADLDIHVLEANDGTGVSGTMLDLSSDCHYANCVSGLDWGVPGLITDDPFQDIDDVSGFGPENINIEAPAGAPYDGWYQMVARDHTTTWNSIVFDVTARVYVNGVMEHEEVFDIPTGVLDYYALELHWPSGAVNACLGAVGCPNAGAP
jgi:hypothetical protein